MRYLAVLLIMFLLVFCGGAQAGTYYVNNTTSSTNWAAATNINTPCTLATANANLVANDTVYLRGGTYVVEAYYNATGNGIAPDNSGTAGNPITYSAYPGEQVHLVGRGDDGIYSIGIYINAKSYIKVTGGTAYNLKVSKMVVNLVIGPTPGNDATGNSSYNEICYVWVYNSLHSADWSGNFQGCTVRKSTYYNHIHHCKFEKHGYLTAAPGVNEGDLFTIGLELSDQQSDTTAYNIIEDNEFLHAGHSTLTIAGLKNIIRNNYIHNENWFFYQGEYYGYRNIMSAGKTNYSGYNLLENNRIAYASENIAIGYGGTGIKLGTPYNIMRYNSFFGNKNNGVYLQPYEGYAPANYNYIYANTFFTNGFATLKDPPFRRSILFGAKTGSTTPWSVVAYNVIKNNLFVKNWNSVVGNKSAIYAIGNWTDGNNTVEHNWDDYETKDDPLLVDEYTINKTSWSLPDIHLQTGSPCIDQGTNLTIANGSGSSSVTLIVNDSLYFQDSNFGGSAVAWPSTADIQADWIAVGTVGNIVQISSINYSTHTITLNSSISWNDADDVWLYKKSDSVRVLYGTAPEYGSHEYDATYQYTAVSLNSPAHESGSTSTTVVFNVTVVDNASVFNVTLYGNWSSGWHANETKSISGTSNTTTFTKVLPYGVYKWNCLGFDNESNSDWGNRNCTFAVDVTAPTYSDVGHSTVNVGTSCVFSVKYDDNTILQANGQYVFGTNNTGSWVNDSAVNWTTTPQYANVTKTLNTTYDMVVGYRWYANDTTGNTNDTTIYTLTTSGFLANHSRSYHNTSSLILNTINSTGYISYNRTLTENDNEISASSIVVTTT